MCGKENTGKCYRHCFLPPVVLVLTIVFCPVLLLCRIFLFVSSHVEWYSQSWENKVAITLSDHVLLCPIFSLSFHMFTASNKRHKNMCMCACKQ